MCGCRCGCTCLGRKRIHENRGWAERWNEDDDTEHIATRAPRRAGGLRVGGMLRLRDTPRMESPPGHLIHSSLYRRSILLSPSSFVAPN
jgi:hypothetical protein